MVEWNKNLIYAETNFLILELLILNSAIIRILSDSFICYFDFTDINKKKFIKNYNAFFQQKWLLNTVFMKILNNYTSWILEA